MTHNVFSGTLNPSQSISVHFRLYDTVSHGLYGRPKTAHPAVVSDNSKPSSVSFSQLRFLQHFQSHMQRALRSVYIKAGVYTGDISTSRNITHCSCLVHQTRLHSHRDHYKSTMLHRYRDSCCDTGTGLHGKLYSHNEKPLSWIT